MQINPEVAMNNFFQDLVTEGLVSQDQLFTVQKESEGLTIWESMVESGILSEEDYARLICKHFGFTYLNQINPDQIQLNLLETKDPIAKEDLFKLFEQHFFVPILIDQIPGFLVRHNKQGYELLRNFQMQKFAIGSKDTIFSTIEAYKKLVSNQI